MSWILTEDWLTLGGSALLTLGTGTQAWDSLGAYKELRATVSETALATILHSLVKGGYVDDPSKSWKLIPWWLPAAFMEPYVNLKIYIRAFIWMPGRLLKLRHTEGDVALQLSSFMRQAIIWSILMLGSALLLTVASIQVTLT